MQCNKEGSLVKTGDGNEEDEYSTRGVVSCLLFMSRVRSVQQQQFVTQNYPLIVIIRSL